MIIPVYHVVASQFPILAATTFEAGTPMRIGTDGYAVKCANATSNQCVGVAGDKNRASEAYEWVNRVSDSGNDAAASGMITLYHSGGEFYVDMNDGTITTPGGTSVSGVVANASTTTPGTLLYADDDGRFTNTAGFATIPLAIVVADAAELASGIPGEYEPGSSLDLVDDTNARNYIKIKLLV